MRGHLEQRGKNVWRAKIYLGRDEATGRKRYLTRTIRGPKRHAEEVVAQLIVEAGLGGHVVTEATVKDLAIRWLATAEPTLSPTTIREYRRLVAKVILPALGRVKLRSLRTTQIDAFYSEIHARGGARGRPLSAQSVHHVHALLRRILNQGVRWGWLSANPATNASPPRPRRQEIHPPGPAQVLGLIAAAQRRRDPDLAVFLRLAALTGARRGELCGLRWSDVDFVASTLTIARSVAGERNDQLVVKSTKGGGAGRRIALTSSTITALATHRNRCDARATATGASLPDGAYIFSDEVDGSRPWRPNRATLAFVRLRNKEGLPGVRLHDLRHAAATQMLAKGVPLRTVAGRLGHTTPSTTLNVYAAWLTQSDQEAADVLEQLFAGPLDVPPEELS